MSSESHPWGGGPYDRPLRTVIITQEDPFYIGAFFRTFLDPERTNSFRYGDTKGNAESGSDAGTHSRSATILGVMIQPSLGAVGGGELVRRIWSLYGTFGFVRIGSRYLAAKIRGSGIEKACRGADVPVLTFPAERSIGASGAQRPPRPNNVNGPTFHRWLRDNDVDLIVSVSASQIFGKTVLGIPRVGCINLHNAPLPRYRGMLPNFWQMYHGETESVLTVHEMVPDLDAGDILMQRTTPIDPDTTLEALMTRTKESSARALWNLIEKIHRGNATARPIVGEGSYFTWPTRDEAREFRRRGKRVW